MRVNLIPPSLGGDLGSICDVSLDLDMPLEVDDEYWENEDPELAFRQPEGKPSLVSGFVQWIKLSHIIAYALKTLVCSAIWGSSDVPPDHAPNPTRSTPQAGLKRRWV